MLPILNTLNLFVTTINTIKHVLLSYNLYSKKIRFNLHQTGSTMTFIINLAICDLLYCTIQLPVYAIQYLGQGPFLTEKLCVGCAILRNINVKAVYMFMGMMATSRCLSLAKITILEKCRKVIAVYVWIFIILIYLPQISYARYVST